ncbi:hypothetical protein SAMN05444008_105176 [Cnuella takakiae]|uniref:Uncharacterized protein n=1 Tax=Cnuella takakiae TaxID=1302690 RepID=A0A1M4ZCT8_9BACT|nr:hypothetical protein [Cnuella takakiae]SHF15850.1 hypothetical protein SAMN05444008_105176 [Cnuella takakiae]
MRKDAGVDGDAQPISQLGRYTSLNYFSFHSMAWEAGSELFASCSLKAGGL